MASKAQSFSRKMFRLMKVLSKVVSTRKIAEVNCWIKFVKTQCFCTLWMLTSFISRKKRCKKICFKKIVKTPRFCTIWLLTTLISREKWRKLFEWINSWKHNCFAPLISLDKWIANICRSGTFDWRIKRHTYCLIQNPLKSDYVTHIVYLRMYLLQKRENFC